MALAFWLSMSTRPTRRRPSSSTVVDVHVAHLARACAVRKTVSHRTRTLISAAAAASAPARRRDEGSPNIYISAVLPSFVRGGPVVGGSSF